MKLLGIILIAFGFMSQANAALRSASDRYYSDDSSYGPSPFIGENMSNEAQIINCRCAYLVNSGSTSLDPTCDNFQKLYQNAIMNAGGVFQGQAPGQTNQSHVPNI